MKPLLTPSRQATLLTALAAWALLTLIAADPARAQDRSAHIRLASSVLRVEVVRQQGGFSLGSGVALAPDKVVTNCHVTRDATEIRVLRSGGRFPAQAQRVDGEHDLCLLRVPGLKAVPLEIGSADALTLGQPVEALGYTGGQGLQASSGQVIALHRLDGGRVVQSSNRFNSGASGGALFDAQQRVVGILTFRLRGGEAHYFSAPSEWLRQLLDDASDEGWQPVAPLARELSAYWERPAALQPRFLQAALLERTGQWRELLTLAGDWLRADAAEGEPWYLLGLALDSLDRLQEAQHALTCAIRIEPALKAARDRLASLQSRGAAALRAAPSREEQEPAETKVCTPP